MRAVCTRRFWVVNASGIRAMLRAWRLGGTRASLALSEVQILLDGSGERGFILGGLVREVWHKGALATPRDIDIAVSARRLDEIVAAGRSRGWQTIGRTSLGGTRVRVLGVPVDIWPVHETWAFRSGRVASVAFESLPLTTPLNIEAVAFEVGGNEELLDAGFIHAVTTGVIETNRSLSPRPETLHLRAARLANRLGFRLGRSVVDAASPFPSLGVVRTEQDKPLIGRAMAGRPDRTISNVTD